MQKQILLDGDKKLFTVCDPVTFPLSEKDKGTIQDLIDTTMAIDNALGVAAPQIGETVRIFVYNNTKEHGTATMRVMINPTIVKEYGSTKMGYEGCLSFPGFVYEVPAYELIKVSYQDESGQKHTLKLRGFEARIFQHEFRHLDGICWPKEAIKHSKEEFKK